MSKDEFIALVFKMRKLQKKYFKSRTKDVLNECKSIEYQVDRYYEKTLFDNGDK